MYCPNRKRNIKKQYDVEVDNEILCCEDVDVKKVPYEPPKVKLDYHPGSPSIIISSKAGLEHKSDFPESTPMF